MAIIMSYNEGKTLSEVLKRQDMTEWMFLEVAANLISKVQEMHDLRVIHNDLKEDNIVVNDELEVSVIDFGCATFDGQTLGYPMFKAHWLDPALQKGGRSNYATDTFSVGYLLSKIAVRMTHGVQLQQLASKMV